MKIKAWKMMSLLMAGTVLPFFGACGDFWQITLANIPVGAGLALGGIPAALIEDILLPLLPDFGLL
jgi:hypothetical protein